MIFNLLKDGCWNDYHTWEKWPLQDGHWWNCSKCDATCKHEKYDPPERAFYIKWCKSQDVDWRRIQKRNNPKSLLDKLFSILYNKKIE